MKKIFNIVFVLLFVLFIGRIFWINKYPFSKEELTWVNLYEPGDSLFFSCGQRSDTIIVVEKQYRTPKNRFGFDWEGWKPLAFSYDFPAVLIYDIQINHEACIKSGYLQIEKTKDGLNISITFGGLDFTIYNGTFTSSDTIFANLQNSEIVPNRDMFYFDGFKSFKFNSSQGFFEYSFSDSCIYTLTEHRKTSTH